MTALNRSSLTITASELDALMATFVADGASDLMNWRAFVNAVEGTARLEGDPDASIETITRTRFSEADAPINQNLLSLALRRIKNHVGQKRLNMKPYFQDFDRHNYRRVTKNQFLAVLDLMGLKLSEQEKEVLARAFQHKEGRNLTSDIDYKRFVMRVDDVETK